LVDFCTSVDKIGNVYRFGLMNNNRMNTEPIWKSWFARHGAKLLLFARQQSRRPDEAEDLLQEAFVRIWRLYGHTGEVSPGLVYRAIRRLAIDWARSIDRRQARENKVALDSPLSFSFERTLEQDERKQALLRAVDRLPDQQKEVLILKIWGELTFDEIARTLDESLNTVASRYRYGLQKLRDWVPEEMEGKKGESSNAS
jgi:RNA polymerase sigma-70 factor (ECF subfamily)